uniref:Double stranded DNA binding protein n=1 Tax=Phthorimaea operculella granulovirus TaxID=192584 RepID=A0A481SFD7_9BBAC|nr:double stranded DNA binding protein [Phthorimaea operculella granulovirus]
MSIVPVTNAYISILSNDYDNMKWDDKIVYDLNTNKKNTSDLFLCTDLKCISAPYTNIDQLTKHITVLDEGCVEYNIQKLDIFCTENKTKTKKLYSIGHKSIGKPKLTGFWDKVNLKMCQAKAKFLVMTPNIEPGLRRAAECPSPWKREALSISPMMRHNWTEEGSVINIPDDATQLDKFYSKFFVLEEKENTKNIENNCTDDKFLIRRMTMKELKNLFELKTNVSSSHEFITYTTFNGVEEKISDCTFYLKYTPMLFIYIKKQKSTLKKKDCSDDEE